MVGAGQIEAGTAGFEREDEKPGAIVALEFLYHVISPPPGHAAVEEEHFAAEFFLEVVLQNSAHLGELSEDQGAVPCGQCFLQHLAQARQLARASGDRGVVSQELGRVVADLLELGKGRQDQAAALDALGGFQFFFDFLHHGRIEGSLLPAQVAKHFHLQLFGQIADDLLIGFEPAQDKGTGEPLQTMGGFGVALGLNRDKKAAFELGLGYPESRG